MITNPWMASAVLCVAALMANIPRPAQAQTEVQAGDNLRQIPAELPAGDGLRQLEASVGHHRLSAGQADWQEASLRGLYRLGDHLWGMELLHAERFNERGTFIGLQDRIHLAPRWDISLAYGLGDGANWLPRDRIDGHVHYTWGERLNWVTNVGLGYYRAPDDHQDRWASVGLTAWLEPYLQAPWIAQGEVRQTQSNPGDIHTQQYFLALTWGRHGQTQITARHGWGREGWQSLGDARSIVDFASRQSTLSIQHWVEKNWGWRLVADQYRNDQYHREGLNLVLFREWR